MPNLPLGAGALSQLLSFKSPSVSPPSDKKIRTLAELLSRQRPWLSPEENWIAAENALKYKPWRAWIIRFSGDKERSGWDWCDLLLRISIPVLILGLSYLLNSTLVSQQEERARLERDRDRRIAEEARSRNAIDSYIKSMQYLVLEKGLNVSQPNALISRIARAQTVAAASAIEVPWDESSLYRGQILLFLQETQLIRAPLPRVRLDGLDLSSAYLYKANLELASLKGISFSGAVLADSNLQNADLAGANLYKAQLQGANLSQADLDGASLEAVIWDEKTKWPSIDRVKRALNIPLELKKQLGL